MREVLDHLREAVKHLNQADIAFPSLFKGRSRVHALALLRNARQTIEYSMKTIREESEVPCEKS